MSIFYDFHIHSCLSPCAEEDMTPYNLVNLSALMGMQAIALTDHNSCQNCGAAMRAGEAQSFIDASFQIEETLAP